MPSNGEFCTSAPALLRAHRRLLSAALFCICLALCGCGATTFKSAATALGLTASNSTVTFGSVPVGKTANAYVKLVNQGSEAVTISNLQITGQNFSSSAQDSLPITVGAESSLNLGVQFSPSTAGTTSGQLTVMNTSSTEPLSVTLSGTGTTSTSGTLSGLTCANSSVTGSATDACTVTLDSAASSDTTIILTSDNSAVTLPATVTVPAGASNAGFTANVSAVSVVQTVTLTAAAAGISQTFTLQLGAVAPNLDVSSLDISFGDVNVDDSSSRSLTLISTGNAPVTIDSIAISGQGYSVAGLASPITLNPNQTATLSVQFSPKLAGTSTGQLTLTTNSSSKKVKLTGNAVPQVKQLSCATTSITAGTSTGCAVTLNAAAATGGLAIALTSSTNAVAIPTSVMVPAGATSASFTATTSTVTTSQTATLTASTGTSSKNFNLQLAASVPTLTLSAASLAFGNVPVNSPASQTLTLSSTGTTAVTVSAAAVTGSGFAASGATFPLTLNPGQSATLTVQFNPTAAGPASGQLTLSSNSSTGSSSVVSLSGAGVPVLSGLSCASGSITGAGADSCAVTLNAAAVTGGFTVNLSSNNSAVTVPASVTVPAGAVSAGFTATASSVTSAQTAILTATAGSTVRTFTLQLGGSMPTLVISSTNLNFGNISVNASATQTLTLSSTGTAAVTVSGATVTGSGFTVSGAAFPLTLNPGQTATLSVQFTPTVAGAAAGQVALSSNSSSGTTSIVSLSGTGIPVLSGLSCSTGSFTGAGTDACTVTLNAAAATGGLVVNLASNNSAVTVPASVTVPAGTSSGGFTATISAVTSAQTAILTASAGSAAQSFTLQLGNSVPTLSISTSSVAFGNVAINSSATQSLTLSSTGSASVTVSSASVTGSGFTISGVTFPLTLASGQTSTLTVQFNPTAAGATTGQLTLISNSTSGTSSVVSLSGTGISMLSGLSCTSNSITGAGTDACTVSLNAAAAAGGFAVNLASSNSAVAVPVSVTVPAGASSAAFTATVSSVTTAQTATITASANSVSKTFAIQLGASVPTLTVSASSVAFGNVSVNSSATQALTLSSTGTASVTVSAASLTGSGFTATGATFPLTLNPGQTATLSVKFSPNAAGAVSGQLTLTSNSSTGSSSVVALSGTGVPVLSGLNCTTASYTGTGTDSCTITLNAAAATGGFVVTVASNNSAVTVPASVTVPAGTSSAVFNATVSAVTTNQTATLTASANSVAKTFSLQLNVTVATLSANSMSISFGIVNLNTPTTQSIVFSSTGSAAVTISAISVTGTGFTVTGATTPLTLNPGQTATLNVVFDPTTSGAVTGQLTITSNSSTGSPIAIALTGTGVSHEVDLTWYAPTSSSDPVAGYNVFRAANGSTSYQQINSTTITQTAFADSNVLSGQTYSYYVVSVDALGYASDPSNVVAFAIP